MKQFVNYKELSINERINLRSGFDVAIAYEKQGKECRIKECASMQHLNRNCCQEVYNIDRVYVSLRTKLC